MIPRGWSGLNGAKNDTTFPNLNAESKVIFVLTIYFERPGIISIRFRKLLGGTYQVSGVPPNAFQILAK